MTREGTKLAYVCAVLNAAIVGLSFLTTKEALEAADPLDTLMYRFAVSFAAMTLALPLGRIKLTYAGKPWPRLLLLASLYPLGFFTLQAYGLQHASSAEGGILFAFTPAVTTVLAALFLRERTSWLQKLSILLSVFGVVFIFAMKGGGVHGTSNTGTLLLILTCFAAAGYSVMARSQASRFSPAEITYLLLGVGFAVFLTVSVIRHAAFGTWDRLFAPLASGTFIVSVLYLGVMSSLATALMSNYMYARLEASKTSVFSNLSTVISIAAGALLLGEQVTWYHLAGSALVIAGVIGANRLGHRRSAGRAAAVKQVETR